jgi:hypothetical protein
MYLTTQYGLSKFKTHRDPSFQRLAVGGGRPLFDLPEVCTSWSEIIDLRCTRVVHRFCSFTFCAPDVVAYIQDVYARLSGGRLRTPPVSRGLNCEMEETFWSNATFDGESESAVGWSVGVMVDVHTMTHAYSLRR